MADLVGERITLISDPSPEFPNNTNVSFKVRLQSPLTVPSPEWEVALASLSIPKRSVGIADVGLASADTRVLEVRMYYEDVGAGTKSRAIIQVKAGELFENVHHVVTSGVEMWQRLSNLLHDKIMELLRTKAHEKVGAMQVYIDECPKIVVDPVRQTTTFDMSMTAKDRPTVGLNLKFANEAGIVYYDKTSKKWLLNPDVVRFTLPEGVKTLTNGDKSKYWRETSYANQLPYTVKNGLILLASDFSWQVHAIDRHFKQMSSANARAIFVYSDVVQSTPMGPQRHHLLRELYLPEESHDPRQMVEPLHYQWIPIAKMKTETIDVTLADLKGKLVKLPQGQTTITLCARPMQR